MRLKADERCEEHFKAFLEGSVIFMSEGSACKRDSE